jgi:ubiquinone biosynthesis protein UbiJ
MLQSVQAQILPSLQARLVLIANHVLSREPVALQRLKTHAGRRVRLDVADLPSWLPAPPALFVQITPAGLFEAQDGAVTDPADLALRVSAPQARQVLEALAGAARPQVQIEGDAALAGDMQWLVENLRWDVEADLADAFGPAVAHQVVRIGRSIAGGLRAMVPGQGAAGR